VNWSIVRSTVNVNFKNESLHKNSHSNSNFGSRRSHEEPPYVKFKSRCADFLRSGPLQKNAGPCHKVLNRSANDLSEFKYGVSDSETTGERMEMANGLQTLKMFWIPHKLLLSLLAENEVNTSGRQRYRKLKRYEHTRQTHTFCAQLANLQTLQLWVSEWVVTSYFLDFLTLEDWTEKLSRNVCKEISLYAA